MVTQENINSKKKEQTDAPADIEQDDVLKFEIETNILIANMKNSYFLGKTIKNGVWVDNPNKKPMMTEELAEQLAESLRAKINPQALISQYPDEKLINEITWSSAKEWVKRLRFNLEDYGLTPENYRLLLLNEYPYLIKQLLYLGYQGFNSRLRTERGKIMITKNETQQQQGGLT